MIDLQRLEPGTVPVPSILDVLHHCQAQVHTHPVQGDFLPEEPAKTLCSK